MAVFYVLLFVPIVIQHFSVKGLKKTDLSKEKKNNIALTFFFLLLTVLVMFRHETVGNDTQNYVYFFNRFSKMDWEDLTNDNLETGFVFFNKTVSQFSKDSRFFLAVSAVAICTLLYVLYKRLCIDPSLTIVLFCTMSTFVMLFSGIRQMLAVGIGVIAYGFVRKKRPLIFLLLVLLAMSFHTSAMMLIVMYPLYHAKITKNWMYAVIPLLFVTFVFNKQIFSVLGTILNRYTSYDTMITQTGAYTMLILFGIFVIFTFLIPDEAKMDEETIGLRNFLLFSMAIQMFAPLHTIAMRMNYYYIIFIPLLIPKIIECRSDKWKQIAVVGRHVMVIFFLAYFFISASGGGGLHVFPYHFFWENV